MKCIQTLLFAAIVVAALSSAQAASPTTAQTAPGAARQHAWTADDFAVYVDQETGFAFIKTPGGWKFIRQIESGKLALVPREFFVRIDQRDGALLAQYRGH
jgi:hypothetical protein